MGITFGIKVLNLHYIIHYFLSCGQDTVDISYFTKHTSRSLQDAQARYMCVCVFTCDNDIYVHEKWYKYRYIIYKDVKMILYKYIYHHCLKILLFRGQLFQFFRYKHMSFYISVSYFSIFLFFIRYISVSKNTHGVK